MCNDNLNPVLVLFVSLFVVAYYSIVHFTDCEDGVGKRRKLWRNGVANKVNHGKCSRRIIPFHLFHSLLAMQILLQRSNVPRLLFFFLLYSPGPVCIARCCERGGYSLRMCYPIKISTIISLSRAVQVLRGTWVLVTSLLWHV